MSNNTDAYAWIGSSGGSWGNAANWEDVTSGQNPATSVPGSLDPVTITGPTGSVYEVIDGGGVAASLALTGYVDLVGAYATGAMRVGTTAVPSGLILVGGAGLSAAAVSVVDGSVAVSGSGSSLSASGTVTVARSSYGGPGSISIGSGATLTAVAGVTVTSGSLSVSGSGATAALSNGLAIGDASGEFFFDYGSVSVASGATIAVTGTLDESFGSIDVSGAGSALTVSSAATIGDYYEEDSDSLSVTSGGFVRFGGLSLQNNVSSQYSYEAFLPYVYVDSTSTLEIGSAGSAAAGAITVDDGNSILATTSATLSGNVVNKGTISETGGALTVTGNVVDSGTISETGGALTINGSLSGSGQVQIGAGATLAMNGTAAAGTTIAFSGSDATLAIGAAFTYNYSTDTYTPYAISATLTGFTTGDAITLADTTLTSASYTQTATNTGTLSLLDGTTLVETLTLAGNYTGRSFLPAPTTGAGSAIVLLAAGSGGSSPVSTNTDAYAWIGSSGGSWGNAANWEDVTFGQNPATSVPGSLDPVTITGPTGSVYEVIDGGGAAASLALTGYVDLVGAYATGAMRVGTTAVPSGLILVGGSGLSAAAVSVVDGSVAVSGSGSSLSASGTVTVARSSYGGPGSISIGSGATLTAVAGVTVTSGSLSVSGSGATAALSNGLAIGDASGEFFFDYGSVSVASGATIAVTGTLDESFGSIDVSGAGSALTVSSAATIGDYYEEDSDSLSVTSGGFVRFGGLSLQNNVSSQYSYEAFLPYVYVDSTSTLEIGSAGSAAAGAITVDDGNSILATTSATLSGNVVNKGTISETGGALTVTGNVVDSGTISETGGALTINGSLSGSGQVQIGAGATLAMNGTAAAGTTIAFSGSDATLAIGAAFTCNYSTDTYTYTPYAISATLTGFTTGDAITLADTTLTNAVYNYAGNNSGTLALFAGTTEVETLTLEGNFSGRIFFISPTTAGSSAVTVLALPGNAVPSSEAILAGISTPLSGFTVSDSNTQATSITVTLSDTSGQLSAKNSGGGSVTGSGSTTLKISGTVLQVNADLATFAYLSNSPASDTIDVTAINSLGSKSLQANVPVTVLAIAPPTISVPNGNVVAQKGATEPLAGVSINYPDGAVPGEQVSVTVSDSAGTLSVDSATPGGGGTVSGNRLEDVSPSRERCPR